MSNKTNCPVICLSLLSGLVFGMASNWLFGIRSVSAQQTRPTTKIVRTERLEIVDKQGKAAATFEILPSGLPRLLVGDNENGVALGSQSVVIKSSGEMAMMGPLQPSGLGKLGMSLISPNYPFLYLGARGISMFDKYGDNRFSFVVAPEKNYATMLSMSDRGNPRVLLMVADGAGSLQVLNSNGGILGSIPVGQ